MDWLQAVITHLIEHGPKQIPELLKGSRGVSVVAHAAHKLSAGRVDVRERQACWNEFVVLARRLHFSNKPIPSQFKKAETQGLSIAKTSSDTFIVCNEEGQVVDIGPLTYPLMSRKDMDLLFVLDEIWNGERDVEGKYIRFEPPPRRGGRKASSRTWGRIGSVAGALGMAPEAQNFKE